MIIEAKITEDDGTAHDKVSRILRLVALSNEEGGRPRYEVIACLAGRGFAVRREDMRRLIEGTRGKVFTLQTVAELVRHSRVVDFVTR